RPRRAGVGQRDPRGTRRDGRARCLRTAVGRSVAAAANGTAVTAQHAGLRRSVATVAVVSAVAVGVWAIWDWETAPIPPVADGQTATAEPSRARFVSADGPSQQRAAVHLPPAIDATTAEVRAPSGETDSTKEVQRRFRFMFERSCE